MGHEKWKRSSEEGDAEDEDEKVMGEKESNVAEVEGTDMAVADDSGARKERSLPLGLGIGLGSKKIALKKQADAKKKAPLKHHKAVHNKVKHETVCTHVPVKRCTSSKQCEKVPWQKCVQLPVKNCKQVPNTKCWTTPHEVCT